MKNRIIIFNLLAFVAIGNVFALPTITSANSTGTTIKFTAKLSEKLPSGYKVKIDYSNGKGSIPMICSSTSCTLSSNTLPTVNAASYKIGIYDAKDNLQNSTIGGDYVISTASIGYSKISNAGALLSDTTKLGSSIDDWACTKDNRSNLVWEVKTNDGGLRDMANKYTNYYADEKGDYGLNTNTDYVVNAVNKQKLCGASNWRLPTIEELRGLFSCDEGKYIIRNNPIATCVYDHRPVIHPINTKYFPDISVMMPMFDNYMYWSAGPGHSAIDFKELSEISGSGSFNFRVRLVHD